MPWTSDLPTEPGWYWLRHAAFHGAQGAWHEPNPIIVELVPDANASLTIYVPGTDWTRRLTELTNSEWIGPLTVPD